MSVSFDHWRGEIWNFNNRIASNLQFCIYHFNNVSKILQPVLLPNCSHVSVWKCINTLLKFSLKHQLEKFCLEFHNKLSSYFYLVIWSNYLAWFVTIILPPGDIEINLGPKSSSRECFSICYWNLSSISAKSYTKVSLLTVYNFIHNFDIICISETFLNSETAPNDSNLEIPNYNMYWAGHLSNCKRGCVCIPHSNTLFRGTKYFKSKWMHQLWGQHW